MEFGCMFVKYNGLLQRIMQVCDLKVLKIMWLYAKHISLNTENTKCLHKLHKIIYTNVNYI